MDAVQIGVLVALSIISLIMGFYVGMVKGHRLGQYASARAASNEVAAILAAMEPAARQDFERAANRRLEERMRSMMQARGH